MAGIPLIRRPLQLGQAAVVVAKAQPDKMPQALRGVTAATA